MGSLLLFFVLGAPAPTPVEKLPPPRIKPVSVVGAWYMTWRTDTAPTWFLEDGKYICDWIDGERWSGTYKVYNKDDGSVILCVLESPDGVWNGTWTATTEPGSYSGTLSDGSKFFLRRQK